MASNIEVISFENFLTGNVEDQHKVAAEIYKSFSTTGWVYLKDFGISQSNVEEMFELAKTFFDKPTDEKLKWKLTDPAVNQGYTAYGEENGGYANPGKSHKECYEHRRFRNQLCPDDAEFPGFKEKVDKFYADCLTLGLNVLKCLAMAMDLGDDYFDNITKHADPQLRLLHYPSIERQIIEQEGHARIRAHTDFGLCTLLFQDSIGGLEVDPFHTGDFKAALPIPGTVLINIADLLQRLTNGRCRSTIHRVVSPQVAGDILPARYSIPFFIHPDPEAMITPVVKEAGETVKYEPVNAGEWRTMHTAKNYEMKLEPSKATAVAV